MALNDVIKDPVTGQEFVTTWDGARGCLPLGSYHERYTRQRSDARDLMTRSATVTLDVRPRSTFFKQEV